jgi:outer membrane protein
MWLSHSKSLTVKQAWLAALTLALVTTVHAEDKWFTGDVGIAALNTQTVVRGARERNDLIPYLAFDAGPMFARIDTFGVRTLPLGKGHLEVLAQVRNDGFSGPGLSRREDSVPIGIGTLQITSLGAFEFKLLRDLGPSDGTLFQARYLAEAKFSKLTLYPELGFEAMDRRYVDYYFGPRPQEVRPGAQSWHASSAVNAFVGILAEMPITGSWVLNAYTRLTRMDDSITNSPLVSQSWRSTSMVALAYRF